MEPIFGKNKDVYYPGDIVSDDRGVYRIDTYDFKRRTCILTNSVTGQIITLTEECVKDMLHPERK
jgi:hypothetical protein